MVAGGACSAAWRTGVVLGAAGGAGDGIPFFAGLDRATPLHLVEVKPYKSGTVLLRYEVK